MLHPRKYGITVQLSPPPTKRNAQQQHTYFVVHESDLAEDGSLAPALVVNAACVVAICKLH